ncbi:acyltransferase [Leptospira gomenensis]|nr:acyltransferase [Leptospira gomenensis]
MERESRYKEIFRIRSIYVDEDVTFSGVENIRMGEGVSFMQGCKIHANNAELKIGNGCSFNNNVFIGASNGKIEIGDKVLIGPNVVLRAADHIFADSTRPIMEQGHKGGIIRIEDDVWIGANVVITSNVKVGKGCVIAAGSVVTKDLPEYSVAAGVPAKVIRNR